VVQDVGGRQPIPLQLQGDVGAGGAHEHVDRSRRVRGPWGCPVGRPASGRTLVVTRSMTRRLQLRNQKHEHSDRKRFQTLI
jgi:hypothetical protein